MKVKNIQPISKNIEPDEPVISNTQTKTDEDSSNELSSFDATIQQLKKTESSKPYEKQAKAIDQKSTGWLVAYYIFVILYSVSNASVLLFVDTQTPMGSRSAIALLYIITTVGLLLRYDLARKIVVVIYCISIAIQLLLLPLAAVINPLSVVTIIATIAIVLFLINPKVKNLCR